ncbi:MAG TPA: hypothetical protein PL193_07740 [Xanthobacteraceae bacterium]|nr:hypothetical protein [Xanthobacteraceae bacterium]
MSYRVLHTERQRPAPTPDLLGLVRNAMGQPHPHAIFDRLGERMTPSGHWMPRGDRRRAIPIRSQALVLALHEVEPIMGPAQRYCPHKPAGTYPRPHKKRGRVNRWLALSPAHGSSIRKIERMCRAAAAEAKARN